MRGADDRLRILGSIEAAVDGRVLDIGGLKQRALLAILLLRVNEPVSRDVLVDQLWGDHPYWNLLIDQLWVR
jgi:DNA-binding SARP family transcriptional activator